jgi:hypothetical protein
MISLKTHNVLDYIFGVVLAFCPYYFNFATIDVARTVFQTAGVGLIVYSLLTNYRYSIIKAIPVRAHMVLDVINGALVLLAPWIFGYRGSLTDFQTGVHVVLGLAVFALVGFTNRRIVSAAGETKREYPRAA